MNKKEMQAYIAKLEAEKATLQAEKATLQAEKAVEPSRKPRRKKISAPTSILEMIGTKVGKVPSDLGFAAKMAIKRSQFKDFMVDWSNKAGYKKAPGNDTDFNLAVTTEGREGSKGARQLYFVLAHYMNTGSLLHIDDLAKKVGENVNEQHYNKARKFLASTFNQ